MNNNNLLSKHCVPCEGNQKPFSHVENIEYLHDLNTWNLINDSAIEKKLLFKDFRDADKKCYEIIVVEEVEDKEFGCAIMDRLRKAK